MRELSQRYLLRARLRLQTPLHVGGAAADVHSDMPLAEDGRGRRYIPGTGVAGALRALRSRSSARRQGPHASVNIYPWGRELRGRGQQNDSGDYASWIVVEDAYPELPENARWEIRDHVGIARDTGAAAPRIKYDRMILPRGTVLPLNLALEVPAGIRSLSGQLLDAEFKESAQHELTGLLQMLAAGIRLGAARSRGLGRARLQGEPEIRLQDNLLTKKGILDLLAARIANRDGVAGTPALKDWRKAQHDDLREEIEITLHWRPTGPVMVKSGEEGIAVDMLPLASADGRDVSLVLPGSGIKGVLRTHAERILRTVLQAPSPAITESANSFLDQLRQQELDLIRWMFGAPGEPTPRGKGNARNSNDAETGLGLAALWTDDVYLATPFNLTAWNAVAKATEIEQAAYAAKPLAGRSKIALDPAMHVAVDRWTGGAAEHQLFSVLEPHAAAAGAWEPIRLTFRCDRLPKAQQRPAFALLLLTLRDMAAGIIPIGFGGNRGLGAISIERVSYEGLELLCEPGIPDAPSADDICLREIPGGLLQRIRDDWRRYVTTGTKEPVDA